MPVILYFKQKPAFRKYSLPCILVSFVFGGSQKLRNGVLEAWNLFSRNFPPISQSFLNIIRDQKETDSCLNVSSVSQT